MFHDWNVVKNEVFLIHHVLFHSRDLFNPLISSLDLSCVMFHLKPSLRNVAIVVLSQWSKLSLYHLGGRSVSSHWCYQLYYLFSLVAELQLKFWGLFHKPTTSLSFCCWFFQQLHSNLLGRVLSKIICGRSWHFLLHSFIPMIYLLFLLPEAWWCCSLHSSSRIVRIVFFSCLSIYPEWFQCLSCHLSSSFLPYSLFLVQQSVFISFISMAFFLSICSTSQGSLVSLVCQRSNFVLPLLFLFRFPPVPS